MTAAIASGRPAPAARLRPAGPWPVAVGIAASTGGPRALATVLGGLPADLPAYVFVVQHIHPHFTPILARRLGEGTALAVVEGVEGQVARPGTVTLAPGGAHMWVQGGRSGPLVRLSDAPPRHGVRPCADVLFTSLAELFGPRAVVAVLTGTGRDGVEGGRAVMAGGGVVLVEAPETCAAAGMPRALVNAGLVDAVLPLWAMPQAITAAVAHVARPGAVGRHRIGRRLAALGVPTEP
jgi:two-component system chemotaxis response regulator CheB